MQLASRLHSTYFTSSSSFPSTSSSLVIFVSSAYCTQLISILSKYQASDYRFFTHRFHSTSSLSLHAVVISQFNAVNAPGSYFASQIALGAAEHLNVFAVFRLHADDFRLTLRGVRYHFRTVVMRHVFERGIPATAASSGPRIPT